MKNWRAKIRELWCDGSGDEHLSEGPLYVDLVEFIEKVCAYEKWQSRKKKPKHEYEIGDEVWILGNKEIVKSTVQGVLMIRDWSTKEQKNVAMVRYQLSPTPTSSQVANFFYRESALFKTKEELIQSLLDNIKYNDE